MLGVLGKVFGFLLLLLVAFSATGPGRAFWKGLFNASGFGAAADAPLAIHFLDVGKADAIVIHCEGHTAVLDGGTADRGATVVDYLERQGLGTLELVIASHPDKDHIGGLPQVLSELGAGRFLRSTYFAEKYDKVDAILQEQGIPQEILEVGERFSLGGAEISVLGPLRAYEETNDSSLVLKLEYNGFSAIFTGDVEKEAEADLVASGQDLSADLLKVPHHGSKTSSSQELLEAVSPQYAVLCVGRDSNNLPDTGPLKRLAAQTRQIYSTDSDGNIVVRVGEDGQIDIQTER